MAAEKMITILFVSADPSDAGRLRLGKEYREIQEALKRNKVGHRFNLQQCPATRPQDFIQAMIDYSPEIVHFSGHGSDDSLWLENDAGEASPATASALKALFERFNKTTSCVILNACSSKPQARAIARHAYYVIGTRREITDAAAIAFSTGFYKGLGDGDDVPEAFRLGCASMELVEPSSRWTMVLTKGSGGVPLGVPADESPHLGPESTEERRRIDAVVPSTATVGEHIDLLVQVRLPGSALLGVNGKDWPKGLPSPYVETGSAKTALQFPVDSRTGKAGPAQLEIRLTAPDFEPSKASKVLDVPLKKSSAVIVFLITPRKAGKCKIQIEVYRVDQTYLGSISLEPTVGATEPGALPAIAQLFLVVAVGPRTEQSGSEQWALNQPSHGPEREHSDELESSLLPAIRASLLILKEALDAVSSMKSSLVLAVAAATIAIIKIFVTDIQTALFCGLAAILIVTELFALGLLARWAPRHKVLIRIYLIILMATSSCLFTSAFFDEPVNPKYLFAVAPECPTWGEIEARVRSEYGDKNILRVEKVDEPGLADGCKQKVRVVVGFAGQPNQAETVLVTYKLVNGKPTWDIGPPIR